MTPADFMLAQCWLVSDDHARPVALRTEDTFDLDLLPERWSVCRSTLGEALAAICAEDARRRAERA